MTRNKKKHGNSHTGLAIFAAGTMALALAVGLEFLGLIGRINPIFAQVFSAKGMGGSPLPLEPGLLWGGSAILAFALPAIIFHIPGTWRRLVVWAGTLAVTISWAPVLVLAAREPQIAVAVIVVLWSGFCAMFYATNHNLPVDSLAGKIRKEPDGTN